MMKDAYNDRLQRAKDKLNEERARRRKDRKENEEDVDEDARSYMSYGSYGSFVSEISRSSSLCRNKGPRSEWRNKAREVIERGKMRKEEARDIDGISLGSKSFSRKDREEQVESLIHRNAELSNRERMLEVESRLLEAAEAEEVANHSENNAGTEIKKGSVQNDDDDDDEATQESFSDSDSNNTGNTGLAVFKVQGNPKRNTKRPDTDTINRSFQEAVAVWEDRCKAQKDEDPTPLKSNYSFEKKKNKQEESSSVKTWTDSAVRSCEEDYSRNTERSEPTWNKEFDFANEVTSSPASIKSEYRARSRSIYASPTRHEREETNNASDSPLSVKSEYAPRMGSMSFGCASPMRTNQVEARYATSPMSIQSEQRPSKAGKPVRPNAPLSRRSHQDMATTDRKMSRRHGKRRSIRRKSPVALEAFRREQLSGLEQSPQLSYRESGGSVAASVLAAEDEDSFASFHEEIFGFDDDDEGVNENAAPTSELTIPTLMDAAASEKDFGSRQLSYREKNAILSSTENIQKDSNFGLRSSSSNARNDKKSLGFPKKPSSQTKMVPGSTKSTTEQNFTQQRLSVFKSENLKTSNNPSQDEATQLTKVMNENRELKSRLEKERMRRTQLDDKTSNLQLEMHQKEEEISKLERRDGSSLIQKEQMYKLEETIKRMDSVVDENAQLRMELDKERVRSARLLDQTKQLQQQVNKKSDEVVVLVKELKRKEDKFQETLHKERTLREVAESQLAKACYHLNNTEQERNDDLEELEQENSELRHAIQRLEMYLKQKIKNDQRSLAEKQAAAQQERRLVSLKEEDEYENVSDHSHRSSQQRKPRGTTSSTHAITSKPSWSTAVSEITTDFGFDELNDSQMGEI